MLSLQILTAQVTSLDGTVTDNFGRSVAYAQLFLERDTVVASTLSDENGYYEFKAVPAGNYELYAYALGYRQPSLLKVSLFSGRYSTMRVLLEQSVIESPTVTVAASRSQRVHTTLLLTQSDLQRSAAVFDDPGRAIQQAPEVSQTNDQGNSFSFLGLSPNANAWYVLGTPIIHPNHLATAGTLNEYPSPASGGVNAFSSYAIERIQFYGQQSEFGTNQHLGGGIDITPYTGSNKRTQYQAQVGLLGLEMSAEGQLLAPSINYFINARYSTVGLLSRLGLDFGGESIEYGDLSANFEFSLSEKSTLKWINLLGGSSNNYIPPSDTTDLTTQREISNRSYSSQLAVSGLAYSFSNQRNFKLSQNIVFSTRQDNQDRTFFGAYTNNQHSIFINQNYTFTPSSNFVFEITNLTGSMRSIFSHQSMFSTTYQIMRHTSITGGIGVYYAENFTPSYSLNVNSILNANNSIQFNAQRNFQQLPLTNFQSPAYSQAAYADKMSLSFSNVRGFSVSGFAQFTQNTPVERISINDRLYFSSPLLNPAISSSNDLAISIDSLPISLFTIGLVGQYRFTVSDWAIHLGGALYNTEFQDERFNFGNSRDNGNWSCNLTIGKEITAKKRSVGIHFRSSYNGGAFGIDPINTSDNPTIELFNPNTRGRALENYFRLDGRISWTKNNTNHSTIWSFDIQNMTNRVHQYGTFYDSKTNSNQVIDQLGIIPVLSYRIRWN